MEFIKGELEGAYIIKSSKFEDDRGHFSRIWCQDKFRLAGITSEFVQVSRSYNKKEYTLRGMHFQQQPHSESKLVHCTHGSVYDVMLDLRKTSSTYMKWQGVELSADNATLVYIPVGCAHGFLTLEPGTELVYYIDEFYHSESGRGYRWDDPAFGIEWPQTSGLVMSEKDMAWDDYQVSKDFG